MSKQSLIKAFEKQFGLTLSVKRADGVNNFVDNGTKETVTTLSLRQNWLERKARQLGVEIHPFTLRSERGAPLQLDEAGVTIAPELPSEGSVEDGAPNDEN